jgi:hypothetical protein
VADGDRKMFAPLRNREAISPESKICELLNGRDQGTLAADLASHMVASGFAVGTRDLVTKRVGEVLVGLEESGKLERIPDGRYRLVRVATTKKS